MTHPDNQLDPDIRYWRQRCEEVHEDNHSLREQLQELLRAMQRSGLKLENGEIVAKEDKAHA